MIQFMHNATISPRQLALSRHKYQYVQFQDINN
jgi:hypothetical protein